MAGFHVVVRTDTGRFYVGTRNPRGRIRFTRRVGNAAAFPTRADAERVTARFRSKRASTTFRVEAV